MNIMVIMWLALAAVLAIIEAFTVSLVTIWFALGAIGATLAAAFGASEVLQIVVFVVLSTLLLIATRPLARKLLKGKGEATNADRLIGAEGKVIEEIDPVENSGQVKVGGKIWSATTANGERIEVGEFVVVESISGVKAVVHKRDAES